MGTMIEKMTNFFQNVVGLIKSLFNEKIVWNFVTYSIKNSYIHEQSKVRFPANLFEVSLDFGSYIAPNSRMSFTKVGKFCSIGPNLICGWGIHPINGISTSPIFYSTNPPLGFSYSKTDDFIERKPIIIGNDVFIGANVTILDGVTIGDGAVIGAGAVVSKDIPAYAVAVGCPIKIIKFRFEQRIIDGLLKSKWWDRENLYASHVADKFWNVEDFLNYNRTNSTQGRDI